MPQSSSTQQDIEIAGIKDGVVILRSGSYRLVMSVSTVNFALKSEEEQNSLVFQYQSFLNSLHFPIEINMQSKRLDLTPYLKKIKELTDKQQNDLLRVQMQDYIDFVSKLINVANIMKKTFFVTIPFEPINLKNATFIDRIFGQKNSSGLKISEAEFKHCRDELVQRGNVVASGLGSLGLRCVQLTTEEVVELFYKIYNPEISGKERVEDTGALTSSFITQKTAEKGSEETKTGQSDNSVIDNTALVEESQKQMAQEVRHKEYEKRSQVVTAPAAPAAGTEKSSKVVENKAAPLNQSATTPQTPPTNQVDNINAKQ